MKPIPKEGGKRDMVNYRLNAILSIFSKILEKIICQRLNSFIEKNKILIMSNLDLEKGNQQNMPATHF
jgi:hypothetical protein